MPSATNASFVPEGKIIVVTGAASGIGAALCRQAAGSGAKVIVLCDLNKDGCDQVAKECEQAAKANGKSIILHTMRCNAGEEGDIITIITHTELTYGPIDFFVANAGIAMAHPARRAFVGLEATDSEWKLINDVNFMQIVYAARQLMPRMARRGHGSFLVTASAAGLLNITGDLPYAVTKGQAVTISEWLASTYGQHGVNISVLCPLGVTTGMTKDIGDSVVASDGMLSAEDVSQDVYESLERGDFLILPHKVVKDFARIKGESRERFVRGQRKLHKKFIGDEIILKSSL